MGTILNRARTITAHAIQPSGKGATLFRSKSCTFAVGLVFFLKGRPPTELYGAPETLSSTTIVQDFTAKSTSGSKPKIIDKKGLHPVAPIAAHR
jgi:hypothetical protein